MDRFNPYPIKIFQANEYFYYYTSITTAIARRRKGKSCKWWVDRGKGGLAPKPWVISRHVNAEYHYHLIFAFDKMIPEVVNVINQRLLVVRQAAWNLNIPVIRSRPLDVWSLFLSAREHQEIGSVLISRKPDFYYFNEHVPVSEFLCVCARVCYMKRRDLSHERYSPSDYYFCPPLRGNRRSVRLILTRS